MTGSMDESGAAATTGITVSEYECYCALNYGRLVLIDRVAISHVLLDSCGGPQGQDQGFFRQPKIIPIRTARPIEDVGLLGEVCEVCEKAGLE